MTPVEAVDEDGSRTRGDIKFGFLGVATAFFLLVMLVPAPRSLVSMVSEERPIGYQLQPGTATITESVNKVLGTELSPADVAFKAKIMIAILFAAAFLWGTETIPLGATDLLIGGLLYLFFILPLDAISKAYMKDAVFFIFGILAIAVGVSKTGLDRRIGILLLGRVKGIKSFCFVFLPLLAVSAGFLSEHALIAILVPVLLRVYRAMCDAHDLKQDRALAVFLLLGICFAANQGGPGSPAAGGRNAIMVGYFREFGREISFAQWVMYAMPFVLIMSFAVGAFMYFAFRRKIRVPNVDFSRFVRHEVGRIGRPSSREILMGIILVTVIVLWITSSRRFGLGGPCVFAVVLMMVFRIIGWKDIQNHVRFDVVGLYAAACAMGVGLKVTGASLWLARAAVGILPASMQGGNWLLTATSVMTGTMTNFMSDGATVASLGPVVLSMAPIAHVHLWKIGLACSFSSSFANALIVGTPNNAIAYVGGTDPDSKERLLRLKDFLIYGTPVTILAMIVFWLACIFGYWKLLPWN